MNPCKKKVSDYQDRLVRDGRKALLTRWSVRPFSDTADVTIRFAHEVTKGSEALTYDCFEARNATNMLAAAWTAEMQRVNGHMQPGDGAWRLLVPHSFYIGRAWLPFELDRHLVGSVALQTLLGLSMLKVAATIAFA